jgi:hypothetical protein
MFDIRFPLRLLCTACFVAVGAFALAGCAGTPVDETMFFANPAKYDLYDCKQLTESRKARAMRVEELERLMARAQTGGAGGMVMAELGYRSDYTAAQADYKLVDRVWLQNRCDTQILSTSPGLRQPASALPANASGGRVY